MATLTAPTPPSAESSSTDNRLFALMSARDFESLGADLEVSEYVSGSLLTEPHERAEYVYFPYSCVVSIINTVAGGSTVEVGTVGNEGLAGLAVYLDSGSTPNKTIVQVAGRMGRVPANVFKELTEKSPALRTLVNKYALAFLAQVSQTAACNRAHTIDERCARWLLMTHDRVLGDTFHVTHEFLAYMLGVRRAGVTVAAGILQKAGLITYKRGKVEILDRAGLEKAACDCYAVVSREFTKLLS